MIHADFPTIYKVEANPELPGTGTWHVPEFFIPAGYRPPALGGHLILKLYRPEGPCIVHFDAADTAEIYTTPVAHHLLIAQPHSDAAWFDLRTMQLDSLDMGAMTNTIALLDRNMLLVHDFWTILAINKKGILWRQTMPVEDCLGIERVLHGQLECSGTSLAWVDGPRTTFKVSLQDGTVSDIHEPVRPARRLLARLFRWRRD